MKYYFEDFTEESYRDLLRLAKENYKFIPYNQYRSEGKNILWRHDIDFSAHRAYRLAKIEAEEGIKSTFFIHFHNQFYNALEFEIKQLFIDIKELGHDLGLHFEPKFYGIEMKDIVNLQYYLVFEKNILEDLYKTKVSAFSIHNPDLGDWSNLKANEIAGMINTYSQYFKENYAYCSDSNGYWRFRPLRDILGSGEEQKLQILTHPAWWTPEPMSPRERISRCINGRALKQHKEYDELLRKMGRKNIK